MNKEKKIRMVLRPGHPTGVLPVILACGSCVRVTAEGVDLDKKDVPADIDRLDKWIEIEGDTASDDDGDGDAESNKDADKSPADNNDGAESEESGENGSAEPPSDSNDDGEADADPEELTPAQKRARTIARKKAEKEAAGAKAVKPKSTRKKR